MMNQHHYMMIASLRQHLWNNLNMLQNHYNFAATFLYHCDIDRTYIATILLNILNQHWTCNIHTTLIKHLRNILSQFLENIAATPETLSYHFSVIFQHCVNIIETSPQHLYNIASKVPEYCYNIDSIALQHQLNITTTLSQHWTNYIQATRPHNLFTNCATLGTLSQYCCNIVATLLQYSCNTVAIFL